MTVSAGVFEGTVPVGASGPQTLFALADAAARGEALAGTPADPAFPAGFTTPGSGPIPAIISTSLAEAPRGVKLGDEFTSSVEGYALKYKVVEVRDGFAGLPRNRSWVVAPREWFKGQAPEARIVPVWEIVSAPSTPPRDARRGGRRCRPRSGTTSVAKQAEILRTAPVTEAVRGLILAAALVTAAYAALGVAAALALAGHRPDRLEVARLRTIGLTSRQAIALAIAEHGPTTLTGFVVGGLLGVALFHCCGPPSGSAGSSGRPWTSRSSSGRAARSSSLPG